MRDWVVGIATAFTFSLYTFCVFMVGYEWQKSQSPQIQTHVVSVLLHTPPAEPKTPRVPELFKKQEHKMEVEAIDESSELYCMAQNVYFEASNQSRAGMVAVAKVVMNRVKNPGWPDTICDVVKQKMQFSWYWDGAHDIPNKKSKAWKRAVEVATEVMYGKVAMDDNLGEAFHYHADYVNPRWAKKKVLIAKIDDHIFYGR
tara:strand:+ start:14944 stop:15546 length:603 start_codon:yes stop_codon:yes gene_type:complete